MRSTTAWLLGSAALLAAHVAGAHEIVVRSPTIVEPGTPTTFQIESTHRPGVSEEVETAANLAVELVDATGRKPLEITANEKDLTLDGTFELASAGPAVLRVHRAGLVWSNTPDGWQEGGRKQHPNAITSNKYEKFTKVLINPGTDPSFAAAPIGDALEIVPVGDVAALKAGDVATLQVLHDGKPVPGALQATYLGFTDVPNSYAWSTESEDGTYKVKLTAPGLWLARAEHKADVKDGDVDQHVMRAILQFEVR